jgi:hypothetical protein
MPSAYFDMTMAPMTTVSEVDNSTSWNADMMKNGKKRNGKKETHGVKKHPSKKSTTKMSSSAYVFQNITRLL